MRKTENVAIEEWQDYCDGKTFKCGDTIERYMKEIKQRLMDKDREEIVTGMMDNYEGPDRSRRNG